MPWLLTHWLDWEYLVHLSNHSDLLSDSILKILVVFYHVNSAQGKILFLLSGFVCLVVTLVECWVRSDLDFLCLSFLLIYELFQVLVSNQLVKENFQGSSVFYFVSHFFVEGTSPPLVMSFRISSHEFGLIANSGEELIDWFFKNYIDLLPYPTLVVNWALLMLIEQTLTLDNSPCSLTSSSNRANISSRTWGPGGRFEGLSVKFSQSLFLGVIPSL